MGKDAPPPYEQAASPNIGFNVPANPPAPAHTFVQGSGQPIYAPSGASIVVTNTPVVQVAFGPQPQPVTCPYCHQQTTSKIITEASSRTHIIAVVLCLIGCIPCCLIPYCMDSCQNRNHYCSSCSAYLGMYNDGGNRW
ncbi:hypothetical protein PPYR_09942 [Photinus pyralis]|uniref:LITAF domain-containing protein n=1 Tax=Photinus pyralis TaxID=7054 RepID=A0A1Y1MSU7_PHOPY|nr:lipopolysaccharide-induced tumor necrosis factor-alpha factor homolog [Photinus pyralis]XP_031347397.1 lipopolysaccharide-induced tumor necrosis factor-alpha factor homolog [Photinus pyralis]KAB0795881.1 hypothetical protein PPYR_09942 [Photinus pyralis]